MIVASLMLVASQPAGAQPTTPLPPNRSRFENVATPDDDVPIGSRVQRRANYVTASERDAAWTLHRLAECLVRTRQQQMLDLLATRLNSPEQVRIVRDAIGWRTRCLQARSMQLDNIILRGAVAEALYRQELRGRQIPPPDRAAEPLTADPARNSAAALQRFGRCMVSRYPDQARALIGTRPGSREESAALDGINAVLPVCLPESPERARHPLLLRGAVGEAFYLHRHGLISGGGAMVEDGGGAPSRGQAASDPDASGSD